MSASRPHVYRDRASGKLVAEELFSDRLQRLLFQTRIGLFFIGKKPFNRSLSFLYGLVQDAPWSAGKIPEVASRFGINLEEFEGQPYRSFNAFFTRRFRVGQRAFPNDAKEVGAPAEGRILVFENLADSRQLNVKGQSWTLARLVGSSELAERYRDSAALVIRLAPADYHRFHAPERLRLCSRELHHGGLFTVHPQGGRTEVFFENRRLVYETESTFGKICWIAVGGFCVGRIGLHRSEEFQRGDEVGWFEMGGSTLIALFEPGSIRFDGDLLNSSVDGVETLIRLGEKIAVRT